MKVITRFSPSPTGLLHIGGARTALYAWLFARKSSGSFILRIEDTDIKRVHKSSLKNILSSLSWLGLTWDQGPFFQSNRSFLYDKIIQYMLKKKLAYKCYCSYQRLQKIKEKQIYIKQKPKYDGKCRNFENNLKKSNIPYVVRFKNPESGLVQFNDLLHGNIEFLNTELDDFIIQRSNGIPTYNFCVVIDDYHMQITHIIRGNEHINNTPKQINLLRALGATIPNYIHVSTVLDSCGKKLSKRENSNSIEHYRLSGYLPEALLNYIVRLGWSCKNKEIFSIKEMQELFNLNSLTRSSSTFDIKKLNWLNNYYLKNLSIQKIKKYTFLYIKKKNINFSISTKLDTIIKLFIHRHNTLQDFLNSYTYLYNNFNLSMNKIQKKYFSEEYLIILKYIYNNLDHIRPWEEKKILHIINMAVVHFSTSFKNLAMFLRIILTGQSFTPKISLIMLCIGKKITLNRIIKALQYIEKFI